MHQTVHAVSVVLHTERRFNDFGDSRRRPELRLVPARQCTLQQDPDQSPALRFGHLARTSWCRAHDEAIGSLYGTTIAPAQDRTRRAADSAPHLVQRDPFVQKSQRAMTTILNQLGSPAWSHDRSPKMSRSSCFTYAAVHTRVSPRPRPAGFRPIGARTLWWSPMSAPDRRPPPRLTDPVSAHLRTGICRVSSGRTVAAVLATLRAEPPTDRIVYFYVVDDAGRLTGVIPTRRLLLAPPDALVDTLAVDDPIALDSSATVFDACTLFARHRFLALPVIDTERRLLGAVDIELYAEEQHDRDLHERSDELFALIGVRLAEARHATPFSAFRDRFPWLLTNVAGGMLAAWLTGLFQLELQRSVALATFLPVTLALAESVAIQSVSLALQALSARKQGLSALWRRLAREFVVGVLLGVGSGLVVATLAHLWLKDLRMSLTLFGGIGAGVACAATAGVFVPWLVSRSRRPAQIAAGPIALACADLATLSLYLSLARVMLTN